MKLCKTAIFARYTEQHYVATHNLVCEQPCRDHHHHHAVGTREWPIASHHFARDVTCSVRGSRAAAEK